MTQPSKQPTSHPQPQTAAMLGWVTYPTKLAALTQVFRPISLPEMDSVALLDRTDTKYVLTTGQLLDALTTVQGDYRILSVDGKRLNHYRTLYFDTPDFALYRQHVNGQADRFKVRSREYVDTRLSFLEVKHRTPKARTQKSRIPTDQPVIEISSPEAAWLDSHLPVDSHLLSPKLWNTFTRITLVSRQRCERVTLDVDLTFYSGNRAIRLDGVAIAEVKMDSTVCDSPFRLQMRAQRIHPGGFSKYAMGIALLYDQVKKNSSKPKLISIEKITGGYVYND